MYVSVYCPDCGETMPLDYVKGRWKCENCGKDLTEAAERQIKREYSNIRP